MNVRRTLLSALVAALLLSLCSHPALSANVTSDSKPACVVSLASYDALLKNVRLVGALSGKSKLAKGFEGMLAVVTHGKGLAGFDKTRPLGAVLQSLDPQPAVYIFLPVDDWKAFQEVLKPLFEKIEDLGDGTYQAKGAPLPQPIFLKPSQNGWLFVCDRREGLAEVPSDPLTVIDGLHPGYDLAVRQNFDRVPSQHLDALLSKADRELEEELKQRRGERGHEYAIRKHVVQRLHAAVLTVVRDLETMTVGWSLNEDAKSAALEASFTAKEGSKTAQAFAGMARAKTDFAGFRLPDSVLTANVAASCPHARSADLDELFGAMRAGAFEEIDRKAPSEQHAKAGKEIVGGLLDVAQATAATGRADGAMSLVLKPEGATLVAARHVASGPKLEEVLGKLVEAARKEHPHFVNQVLKTDVGEFQGVRFHTVTLDVPPKADNRDKIVQFVGEKLHVVVGIGEQSVYFAAGKNAMATLKQAIERSASGSGQGVPPMELSVALGQVARFLAEVGGPKVRQKALEAVAAMEQAPGKDHVRLRALAVENGVKLRLELEEAVLKAIELMNKS